MGNLFSPTHLLIILLIILILFGRGKISEFMGDFAKGIKSFKKGLSDEDENKPRQNQAHLGEEKADSAASKRETERDSAH